MKILKKNFKFLGLSKNGFLFISNDVKYSESYSLFFYKKQNNSYNNYDRYQK